MGHRSSMFPEYYDENWYDATNRTHGIYQKVNVTYVQVNFISGQPSSSYSEQHPSFPTSCDIRQKL